MTVLTSFRLAIPSVFLAALGCAPTEPPTTSAEQRLKAIEEKLDRLTKSVEADTIRRIDAAVRERTIALLKAEEQRLQELADTVEQEQQEARQKRGRWYKHDSTEDRIQSAIQWHRQLASWREKCAELKTEAAFINDLLETAKDADAKETAGKMVMSLLRKRGTDIASIQQSIPKETRESGAEFAKFYLSLVNRDLKETEEKLPHAKERTELAVKAYQESLKWDSDDARMQSRVDLANELRNAEQKRLQEAQAPSAGEAPLKK